MSIDNSFSSPSSTKSWIIGGLAAAALAVPAYFLSRRSGKFWSRVIGIIPARFASSRFQGKPLVDILGKPMIQLWQQMIIRLLSAVKGFDADVVMTSQSCRNGTERCNEALQMLGRKYDVVVNIQDDEPLIEPEIIDGIVKVLQSYDAKFLKIYSELPPTPLQLEEDS